MVNDAGDPIVPTYHSSFAANFTLVSGTTFAVVPTQAYISSVELDSSIIKSAFTFANTGSLSYFNSREVDSDIIKPADAAVLTNITNYYDSLAIEVFIGKLDENDDVIVIEINADDVEWGFAGLNFHGYPQIGVDSSSTTFYADFIEHTHLGS